MIHTIGRGLAFGFLSCICVGGAASAQTEVAIPQRYDPLLANQVIPANSDAHIKGLWSPLVGWDLNPIHMAAMPDGRGTTFGSSGLPGDENNSFGIKFDIWNPRRGFAPEAHRSLGNVEAVDSFCSASTLLKTGELWTAGGRQVDPNYYLPNDKVVVVNSERNAVVAGVDMEFRRYYATMTTLADGRHLITGGSVGSSTTWAHEAPWNQQIRDDLSPTPEVFTQGGGWDSLFGAKSLDDYVNTPQSPFLLSNYDDDAFGPGDNRWWYPRQWVAPNGKVFLDSTDRRPRPRGISRQFPLE